MTRRFLFLCSLLAFALGCAKNNLPQIQDTTSTLFPASFYAQVIVSKESIEESYPRLLFRYNDWSCAEIDIPEHKASNLVFQFVNATTKESILMVTGDNFAAFTDYDPRNKKIGDKLFVLSTGIEYNIIALFIKNASGDYEIAEVARETVNNTKGFQKRKNKDFDDIKKSLYDNLIDKMTSFTSLGADFMPGAVQYICQVWSDVLPVVSKYMLYSDDPEKLAQIRQEEFVSNGKKITVNATFSDDIKDGFHGYTQLTKLYKLFFSGEKGGDVSDADVTESHSLVQNYNNYPPLFSQKSTITGTMPYDYDTDITCTLKGTTAYVTASYTSATTGAGHISELGLRYGIAGGDKITEQAESFPHEFTIENLMPGETYTFTAYLKSMGITYTKTVAVQIDPLNLYPTSLTFYSNGGSKAVAVDVPEGWTWDISSAPGWCKIEKGSGSFFVDVESYNENRQGEIIVSAKSPGGNTISSTVKVRQQQRQLTLYDAFCNVEKTIRATQIRDFIVDGVVESTEEEVYETTASFYFRYQYDATYFDIHESQQFCLDLQTFHVDVDRSWMGWDSTQFLFYYTIAGDQIFQFVEKRNHPITINSIDTCFWDNNRMIIKGQMMTDNEHPDVYSIDVEMIIHDEKSGTLNYKIIMHREYEEYRDKTHDGREMWYNRKYDFIFEGSDNIWIEYRYI